MMKSLLAALIPALLLVASASAQPVPDHLECYKVKDLGPKSKVKYTADLNGLAVETGCQIQLPARQLCVQTTKLIMPTPPGGSDTAGPAGRFACYKVKCPKGTVEPVTWLDQFGSRPLAAGAPGLLCAPEIVPTTTTTTSTTTTTTTIFAAPVCCSYAALSCNSAADSSSCDLAGGSPGSAGTVCDAATGRCAVPAPGVGNCCTTAQASTGSGCLSGPYWTPANCTSSVNGTPVPGATCPPSGGPCTKSPCM